MTIERVPGWDAITSACDAIYGARAPKHYGMVIKWVLGSADPLDGISVYASERGTLHRLRWSASSDETSQAVRECDEAGAWRVRCSAHRAR